MINSMEHPNSSDLKKRLIEMNVKIREAEKTRDEAFLKTILADDLTFRRASGKIVNKNEYLTDLQDSANTFEYLISEDVKPAMYEGVAVVSLRVRAKGKRMTGAFEGTYRNIRLFLRKNEEWQCV
jgi:hypothetical protein